MVGEIEAVKVSVLGRDQQEFLAALRPDQGRRVGDVPIVPVLRHKLEMVLVSPGLGVEHDDRVGIEILALARTPIAKSGAGLPPGTYNRPVAGSNV